MYSGLENTGVERGDEIHTCLAWWSTRAEQSVRDEIRSCPSPQYLLFPELVKNLTRWKNDNWFLSVLKFVFTINGLGLGQGFFPGTMMAPFAINMQATMSFYCKVNDWQHDNFFILHSTNFIQAFLKCKGSDIGSAFSKMQK